jgi:MarR family transcriptional regulator, organic hydroperoxide resistance regulator
VAWCPNGNELDQDIADALADFFTQLLERGETLAEEFGVPAFVMKAVHRLDGSVTMKELGRRMHCDPSFVTMIADTLERRGLARREANAADRRIKNLVLTPEGLELKARMERAMLAQMPWSRALDASERASFLSMTRKMNVVLAGGSTPPARHERTGEVSDIPAGASRPHSGLRSEAEPAKQN